MHARQFDAADEEAVKKVVDDAIKAYGRLDIFFANAGIVGQPKIFTDVSADEFLHTLRTNVVRYECPPLRFAREADVYVAYILLRNMPPQQ